MKFWSTDGSIDGDSRYSRLVRWFASRGFYGIATILRRIGL